MPALRDFVGHPKIVKALQFTGGDLNTYTGIVCDSGCHRCLLPHVHTIHEGQVVALEIGDWVVQEPDGVHYYPVRDNYFRQHYSEAL